MPTDPAILDRLTDLVALAKRKGAEGADALFIRSVGMAQSVRLGQPERREREESQDIGLRILIGQRQAAASSADMSPAALDALADRVVAMAKAVPEDPFIGLASPEQLAKSQPDLDLEDPVEPSPERLSELALACEDAARAVPGITNSEGGDASWSRSEVALVASNGFAGAYARTGHFISAAVIAGSGEGMERDYDYHSAIHAEDLEAAEEIGRRAGERTVKRLDARKVETTKVPVVYDPRVSGSLLGHLAGAINGAAVARGTSFLKSKLGEVVLPEDVTVVDDPFRLRGRRSHPFDGEGLAGARRAIVDKGRLTGWFLDLGTARQLGLESSGSAARGTGGPPSPSPANLYMEPGAMTPEAMIAEIEQGFYVTEMMGRGVNDVTGDYSRGASGFWIENGEIAFAVSGLTIAGNLLEMYPRLTAANDLTFRTGMDAPTLRIDGLTVAGV
ncbi:MAG: TldD/PmbA family protein [Rhodospirillales bacterium]